MEECHKCGMPETKTVLYEAILPEGIVKICKNCSRENDPMIRNAPGGNIKVLSVYERLRKLSGIDKMKRSEPVKVPDKDERELKRMVEENFTRNYKDDVDLVNSLIDNFKWVAMRARRIRHLTQEQLAKEINEPEIAIKMLEEGKVQNVKVIEKVENKLGITLRRQNRGPPRQESSLNKEISFKDTKNITISNIRDMTKKQDADRIADKLRKLDDDMDREMRKK